MVLTADYQLLRDGATLVGVVTGVDAILEGDLSAVNDDPMPGRSAGPNPENAQRQAVGDELAGLR